MRERAEVEAGKRGLTYFGSYMPARRPTSQAILFDQFGVSYLGKGDTLDEALDAALKRADEAIEKRVRAGEGR
jgi:hypothetical protein